MEERGAGGREGGATRWAIGVVCALAVAVLWLAAPQASAAAGDLDGTFGTGGKVTTDFAGNGDLANAVALQPDGKIVAAGGALGTTVDFALARYRPDGTLDATFGTGGKVRTDFGSGEQAFGVAVQPDGKIVAVGGVQTEFELARYNADGSLDGTFGVGGKVTTRFGLGLPFTRAQAIVLQPDGKIVVAGTATPATRSDFGLARYNPNGTLDATFGSGGKVTTDIRLDSADFAWAVALQLDGKLVVAGWASGPSGDDFALVRYTPSGGLDSTFGSSGRVTTDFGGDQDWAQAVAVQADGKIVAAGRTGNQCCGGTLNFALARYNANGTLDGTFGTGGKVTTDFAGSTDDARALVIQADGKILAAGERLPGGNVSGASFDFALARYQPSGTLDGTFGTGGLVTTDFPGRNDHVYALALQQDGKVVAAGESFPDFALARYVAATVNNPPVASNDSYATAEDTPLTVPAPGVLANDSDADGDPLTAAPATGPAHGTLTLSADGSFAYTPAANFNGTDTFTYKANDGLADSSLATVTITVSEINDAPMAAADSATLAEDASTVIDVTANDTPGPGNEAGQALSVSSVGRPAHGQAAIITGGADAGKVRYTPAADYNGPDSFAYTVCDEGQTNGLADPKCDTATVTIAVTAVNDAPVAGDDSYGTDEDTPLRVPAPGVLANDSDADGDPLTAAPATGPAHGELTLTADGFFTYTPDANFNGTDSFTYNASDGLADSNAATVTITVAAVPDAPVAGDDSYATAEDTPLTVAAPGVLANDSDADGDSLTATLVTGPAHGTLTLSADGSLTYTPAANFNGQDSFTYKASDGLLESNAATVTITVTEVNDPPTAAADQATLAEDASATIDVTANDTPGPANEAGQALSVSSVGQPAHGQAALITDGADAGKVRYTPASDYTGPDSFTYTVCDNGQTNGLADPECDSASVAVTVTAVADAPVATNDGYATAEDTPLTVAAPGVLANDSDADGDSLTATLVTGPAHGTLTLSADGSLTYTPAANFNGQDSFTYKANDGGLTSNVATVTITIGSVPDAPVAHDDVYRTNEVNTAGERLTVAAPGVLANDSDADGDLLTATLATSPAHGSLFLNANGSFTYTPRVGFSGQDFFTYKANDGAALSNPAKVFIIVAPKILFASTRDSNWDIYVMNADGSGVRRLTTNAALDTDPVWSPDHTSIAFQSMRDGNSEIYTMAADGTGQTRLTSNPASDIEPAWSPDGRIVFASTRDGNWEIYTMRHNGTAQTRLTFNSALDMMPAPSPDGRRIAFASTRNSNWEIYTMAADGTAQTRLTSNSASDIEPDWSPDGRRIAFASTRDDPNLEIYAMNTDGTAQTRLTSNSASDESPAWSPDSQMIAFSSMLDGNPEIYALRPGTTSVTRLTTNPAVDAFPDW